MRTLMLGPGRALLLGLAAVLLAIGPLDGLPRPTFAANGATTMNASRNWAGYVATGGPFTAVNGTWTVPQVSSGGRFGADAAWVGIGGVTSRDLIQSGTQALVNRAGKVRYEAWIEMLPAASQPIPVTVNGGDSVTVTITQQSAGQWQIAFKDNTNGQSYQTTVSYNSSLSSAEWIQEAPSLGRRVMPLDNFGTLQFSGGSAVLNGSQVTIAQAGAKPVALAGVGGQVLATPSALGSDGASFSVTRNNPTVATPRQGFAPRPWAQPGLGIWPWAPTPRSALGW